MWDPDCHSVYFEFPGEKNILHLSCEAEASLPSWGTQAISATRAAADTCLGPSPVNTKLKSVVPGQALTSTRGREDHTLFSP